MTELLSIQPYAELDAAPPGRMPFSPGSGSLNSAVVIVVANNHYNYPMAKNPTAKERYTSEHAAAGLDSTFPEIETWPNQFPGYEIVIDDPEFTSVCPKTGLPDFGVITLRYQPDKACLELKSYKEYLHCYRNLGIFQENVVNRVLEDVVRCARPIWAEVKGDFRPRGGISTMVIARWPRGRDTYGPEAATRNHSAPGNYK